jgi:tripartite-type tricarboxylate transporter receptor subunit TctC
MFGASVLAVAAVSAHAQAGYPTKPIRLIVPFPPGGGTDMIARSVAQKVTEKTSWNIVVDNRPGAGGNLGWMPRQSPRQTDTPWSWDRPATWRSIRRCIKLPYDPLKDLAPVALVSSSPILMVSGKSFTSMAEVLKAAKQSPT